MIQFVALNSRLPNDDHRKPRMMNLDGVTLSFKVMEDLGDTGAR